MIDIDFIISDNVFDQFEEKIRIIQDCKIWNKDIEILKINCITINKLNMRLLQIKTKIFNKIEVDLDIREQSIDNYTLDNIKDKKLKQSILENFYLKLYYTSLMNDIKSRDFRLNSLYYDVKTKNVIDFVNVIKILNIIK